MKFLQNFHRRLDFLHAGAPNDPLFLYCVYSALHQGEVAPDVDFTAKARAHPLAGKDDAATEQVFLDIILFVYRHERRCFLETFLASSDSVSCGLVRAVH